MHLNEYIESILSTSLLLISDVRAICAISYMTIIRCFVTPTLNFSFISKAFWASIFKTKIVRETSALKSPSIYLLWVYKFANCFITFNKFNSNLSLCPCNRSPIIPICIRICNKKSIKHHLIHKYINFFLFGFPDLHASIIPRNIKPK